ncbi:MAG TPA: chemotaxis protein CheW [Gemmatimonadaceae bacterium]|nr:chemotaxis protein CheW [Gemmatimonadaceae bacterium]
MATLVDPQLSDPAWDESADGESAVNRTLRAALAEGTGTVELLLFRVGSEFFGLDLAAVEEAVELPAVHAVPEAPGELLGVFHLRDRLVPVYSTVGVMGVSPAADASVALVMRAGDRRIGLAVDDVEDVLSLDVSTVQRSPVPDADNVLMGVALHHDTLVSLLDAAALAGAYAAQLPGEST